MGGAPTYWGQKGGGEGDQAGVGGPSASPFPLLAPCRWGSMCCSSVSSQHPTLVTIPGQRVGPGLAGLQLTHPHPFPAFTLLSGGQLVGPGFPGLQCTHPHPFPACTLDNSGGGQRTGPGLPSLQCRCHGMARRVHTHPDQALSGSHQRPNHRHSNRRHSNRRPNRRHPKRCTAGC